MNSRNFVDCFVLMNTALTLTGSETLHEMSRPKMTHLEPTTVNVSVSVEDVRLVNTKKMELQVTLLLHQKWVDSRLSTDMNTKKMAVLGQIWKPKVTIVNGIPFNDVDKDDSIFWRGFGYEGEVLLSEKIIFNVWCTTDFRFFPFDHQVCEFKFGSYRFPVEEVELAWTDKKPIEIIRNFHMNEFDLRNFTTCNYVESRPSGNFSILAIQLSVQRYSRHYILCVGLPSTLAIVFSYFAHFVKMENIRIRLTINALCLIVLLNIYTHIFCLLNVTPYLKAIDVYSLLNLTFAIISMIETIIACLWFRRRNVIYKTEKKLIKFVIWLERSFKIGYLLMYIFSVLIFSLIVI